MEELLHGGEVYGFGLGAWLAFLALALIVLGLVRYFFDRSRTD